MSENPQLFAVQVANFADANLATLTAAVNAFLAGQGTPVMGPTARLVKYDLRYDATAGVYFATILYSGN